MDFVSHSLWGGISVGRRNRRQFFLAIVFSLVPDLLGEGIMFLLQALGLKNMPGLEHGHPNITEFPAYAQSFYNATHSLIIFLLIFLLVWLIRRRPLIPMAAWGIHILIDIPTHSLELFPTPFLWPLSSMRVNCLHWENPVVLAVNFGLLTVLYSFWSLWWRKGKT